MSNIESRNLVENGRRFRDAYCRHHQRIHGSRHRDNFLLNFGQFLPDHAAQNQEVIFILVAARTSIRIFDQCLMLMHLFCTLSYWVNQLQFLLFVLYTPSVHEQEISDNLQPLSQVIVQSLVTPSVSL
jgi:hypothetical protein